MHATTVVYIIIAVAYISRAYILNSQAELEKSWQCTIFIWIMLRCIHSCSKPSAINAN